MPVLNDLSSNALSAAMRGGTAGWGAHGSAADHLRYMEPKPARKRRKCTCGCDQRATHYGLANGVVLMSGCEVYVRRWVRDGYSEARPKDRVPSAKRKPTLEEAIKQSEAWAKTRSGKRQVNLTAFDALSK